MATVGFEQVIFNIKGKRYVADKKAGGAIEMTISGLSADPQTTWASNVPFHVVQVGTGETTAELGVADLLDGGLYQALMGIEQVEGFNVVGDKTEPPYVSVIGVTSNRHGNRFFIGLTQGKFSHPDVEVATGEEGGSELKTDSLEGAFVADNRGYTYISAVEDGKDTTLEKFEAFINKGAKESEDDEDDNPSESA